MVLSLLVCLLGYVVAGVPWPVPHHDWGHSNKADPNTPLPSSPLCPKTLVKFHPNQGFAGASRCGIIITPHFLIVPTEVPRRDAEGPFKSYFFNPHSLEEPPSLKAKLIFSSANSDGTKLFAKFNPIIVRGDENWFIDLVCFDAVTLTQSWRVGSGNDYFSSLVYDEKREIIYLSCVPETRNNAVWIVDARNGTILSKSRWLRFPDDNGMTTPSFLVNPVTGYLVFPFVASPWLCYNPQNWTAPVWSLTSPILAGLPSPNAVVTDDGILLDAKGALNLTSGTILWENKDQLIWPLGLIRTGEPPADLYLGWIQFHNPDTNQRKMVAVDPKTGTPLTESVGLTTLDTTSAVTVGSKIIYAIDTGVWVVDVDFWEDPAAHQQLSTSQLPVYQLALGPNGTLFAITSAIQEENNSNQFSVFELSDPNQCPPFSPPSPPPAAPAPPEDPSHIPKIVVGTVIPAVIVCLLIAFALYKRYLNQQSMKAGYQVVN